MDFNEVRLLEGTKINKKDNWVYIADFNINDSLEDTSRVDCEVEDLKQLSQAGAITSILAHKGRYNGGDASDLDFIVSHLSKKLGAPVKYSPQNNTEMARKFVKSLKPGDVAIMGNTRSHSGEEDNDSALAGEFAGLGKFVALGGFGKAHRENASNFGILDYLPGYLTRSQTREMEKLKSWAGEQDRYSIAVLGGVKKEKITIGLEGFVRTYDFIIPGGIVLNTILKNEGYGIGDSVIRDSGKSFERQVSKILGVKEYREKIYIPSLVVVSRKKDNGFEGREIREISKGVFNNEMIVDFILSEKAKEALDKGVGDNGRIILAGTPGLYKQGFRDSTDPILKRMSKRKVQGIVFGGDTAAELNYSPSSTGGGSALYFVANGTTTVFEKLRENKNKFF